MRESQELSHLATKSVGGMRQCDTCTMNERRPECIVRTAETREMCDTLAEEGARQQKWHAEPLQRDVQRLEPTP